MPSFLVTWMVLPETEAMSPATWSFPLCSPWGAAEDVAGADEFVDAPLVFVGVPQAATESAVSPASATVRRGRAVVGRVSGVGTSVFSMVDEWDTSACWRGLRVRSGMREKLLCIADARSDLSRGRSTSPVGRRA